ncbi:MAG: hypothetical protein H0U49_06985 [Parachlamydiaceae bacterium]|nr:hypothetical protein [Parachlamydiaceae bacterium]
MEALHDFVISGIGQDDEIDFKKGSSGGILGDERFIEHVQNEIDSNKEEKLCIIDLSILISVITNWYDVEAEMLQAPGIERKMTHIRPMASSFASLDILKLLGNFGQIQSLNTRIGIWSHDLHIEKQDYSLNPSCEVCGFLQKTT